MWVEIKVESCLQKYRPHMEGGLFLKIQKFNFLTAILTNGCRLQASSFRQQASSFKLHATSFR
jgi:hypothetical protein